MEYFSDMSQIYATKLLYSLHTNNLLFFFFSSSCIQYVKVRFAPCGAVVSRKEFKRKEQRGKRYNNPCYLIFAFAI
jgi:hypothetical protein